MPEIETTDALLDDPGDLNDDREEIVENVTEAVATIGGRETLRLAAIMNALEAQGLALDEDGSAARTAQLQAIKALIEGDDSVGKVLEFARMLTPNALLQNAVADAIVLTWQALDGDATALDALEPQTADAAPVHKAVCMVDGCQIGVVYKLTGSGTGFIVLERNGTQLDATFGAGSGGRPICPIDGHGEMTLADETIPAAEAFAQVAEKLDGPVQRALPGVFPVFNYAGAFNEIVQQAKRVERLNSEYDDAKKEASEAKKNLDKGAELLMRMTLQFEQRRREKPESAGASLAAPRVLKCIWDQQHPDEACPFCDTSISIEQRAEIVRVLGEEILPTEANGHADQVLAYRTKLDIEATLHAIDGVLHDVPTATVADWSAEQRAVLRDWAEAVLKAESVDSEPPFPSTLGLPHIAAAVPDGAKVQACETCGSVIRQLDVPTDALNAGDFVRLDCAGTDVEGHRYPDTAKPKKAARPKAEKPEKPAKKKAASKKAKK
jgi:rubrerythrin